MPYALGSQVLSPSLPVPRPGGTPFHVDIWQAPLVPAALALTAGIVLDRYLPVPLLLSLVLIGAALAAWTLTRSGRQATLGLVYLGIAVAAFGAGYHHWRHDVFAPDDIGELATEDPQPIRIQGTVEEEPQRLEPVEDDLLSVPRAESTEAVLRVTSRQQGRQWVAAGGLAGLRVAGRLPDVHVGDHVEVVGRLVAPRRPANPGEADVQALLVDRRIRAEVIVRGTPLGVTRLAGGWPHSLPGLLAGVRGWAGRQLDENLPPEDSGVARALLLGEDKAMSALEWDEYIRTGVVHVLAISGLHLVVLAGFLWAVLRLLAVPSRRGAWLVALLLVLYAALTGGRPPVLRATVTVVAFCLGLYLRRPVLSANTLALAWVAVALANPANVFHIGCQLSFLAVAVLYWGCGRWFARAPDPWQRLIDQSRPPWQQHLRRLGRKVALAYAVTAVVWLAQAPLVAARYHLVAPPALLLGPPAAVLASAALISGFLLLLVAAVCPLFVPAGAALLRVALLACRWLVHLGDGTPGVPWFVGNIPEWWLWVFYVGLMALLMLEPAMRRWRWAAVAALAWGCIGLGGAYARPAAHELRCTFLAVGHGGCVVLETPDGRVLLYDAGTIGGPDVTRRQIAPFLWHRGIRRIDEVFLSHADLDHFNGLPSLMDRFAVGQVTWTPTFADKPTAAVRRTLEAIERHRIPVRVVHAGDRLSAGEVAMDVLHPPASGLDGNENAHSLVLLVRHAGHTLLLTGDLDGPGMTRVLALPRPTAAVRGGGGRGVDVLMAPHHGSRIANTPALAEWARPRVVLACQGPPQRAAARPDPYTPRGAVFLGTWPHGAITVLSRPSELTVETFRTQRHFQVPSRSTPADGL